MEILQESPAQLSSAIRLCSLALCFDLRIPYLLTPNLVTTFVAIPPSHCAYSYATKFVLRENACGLYDSVMVTRLASYGAATKPRASCGLQPQGCAARHALVSKFLVMIHCRTASMCYFHVSSSLIISPYLVKRSVRRTRYHRTSF